MCRTNELISVLATLGETADDIAVTLKSVGIKGVRNSARFLNPIVRYCQLQLHLDDYLLDLEVRGAMRISLPNEILLVDLPPPVKTFLVEFDLGVYPDLELIPLRSYPGFIDKSCE